MRVGVLIQARSNSERLPAKIYAGLPRKGDCSVLEHIYRRMQSVSGVAAVAVLVPESDEAAIDFCQTRGLTLRTGPEHDVRARYRRAAEALELDVVVRATGDNPLVDPVIAGDTIRAIQASRADLVSYSNLPLGVAVEAFKTRALLCDEIKTEPNHLEHVSLHIKHNPDFFRILHLEHALTRGIDAALLPRLTVDTAADLEVVRQVYERLGKDASTEAILKLATREPAIFRANSTVQQRSFATAG